MSHQRSLSNVRTGVRDNLDESTASFWTNAQLLRYINRAKGRVWMEVRKLKDDYFIVQRTSTDGSVTILGETYATSSFAIVAGTRNYTLPPDLAEMKLIEVTTSGYENVRLLYRDLTHPQHRAMRELTDRQTPSEFYFDLIGERTLTIAPLSNAALDLRLTYVRFIADLADDTDTLEMPNPLVDAVEAYATASAMLQDRDPNAAVWEQRAKAIIAEFMGAHARQTQDPEFVTPYLADWTGAA